MRVCLVLQDVGFELPPGHEKLCTGDFIGRGRLGAPFNQKVAQDIVALIQCMVDKGAVFRVLQQRCFQSNQYPSFTVPKPGGSKRLILDLSVLSKCVQVPFFKMTNHNSLRLALTVPS